MFHVKKHSKQDWYPIYSKWCIVHQYPVVNQDWFPEICFVCYFEEIPIYSIWFWHTDSKLAWCGFLISNKEFNHKKRVGGMEFLMNYVSMYAKRKKYVTLLTMSGIESIMESTKNSGFIEGDTNITQFFKLL